MAEPSDPHHTSDASTPEAGGAAPGAPEAAAPARSCVNCGAGLAADQDWCLECGTAQPGRLGRRPGRRAVLAVLALTGVLAGGATAASYAALEHDPEGDAVATAPGGTAPPVAQTPPQTLPGAPAAGTEVEETPTIEAPDSEPATVPEPSDVPAPEDDGFGESFDDGGSGSFGSESSGSGSTGSSGSGSTGSGGSGSSGSGGGSGSDTTGDDDGADTTGEPERVALEVPEDAASLYDPYSRVEDAKTAKKRDPARALDGKANTAWEIASGEGGVVNAGLVISLDEVTSLSDLELQADTPGFTVEVYATRATKVPSDVLDERWEHLTDRRDAGVTETLRLDGRYRHVLLWFTRQPADTKIAIAEIKLFED